MAREDVLIKPNFHSSSLAGLFVSLLLAAGFVYVTFELAFVLGLSPYWLTEVDDVTQYISGFNVYFRAPWQLPLLAFDGLNYPQGTRVTFVDAIPLYAVLLKALLPTSLAPFNPYGIWVVLCFVLQAVGAWWISRELRLDSWVFLISIVVIFLFCPALMARIGHISLMSHWVILFALALYIRGLRCGFSPLGWTVLLVAAFYINIYLFAMATGIYFAAMLATGTCLKGYRLVTLALPLVILLLSLFVTILPLPPGGVSRETGFGFFSMNMLSPIMGGGVFQIKASEVLGQAEGFNYLGLGVILSLVAAFWIYWHRDPSFFKRHWPLFVLMIAYTAYSLSSHIYFGSTQVLELKYPPLFDYVTSQFRASGRFFWPVAYSLMIFALLMLFRRLGRGAFFIAVTVVVVLQLADLNGRYEGFKTVMARESERKMDYSAWDRAIGDRVRNLYFYPKFTCGVHPPSNSLLPVMRYVSLRSYNINTGYIARYNPSCGNVAEEIKGTDMRSSAYIFVKNEYDNQIDKVRSFLPKDASLGCGEVDFAFVCSPVMESK